MFVWSYLQCLGDNASELHFSFLLLTMLIPFLFLNSVYVYRPNWNLFASSLSVSGVELLELANKGAGYVIKFTF
jgi:hypothetical protein